MSTSQLLSGALVATGLVLAAGCSRTEAKREAHEAAAEVRTAAAHRRRPAGRWLADHQGPGQYFADREIKARYINVSTRDGVVGLSGYVESPEARLKAVQIARNTDGVRSVEDKLLIGVAPGARTPSRPALARPTPSPRWAATATTTRSVAANAATASFD